MSTEKFLSAHQIDEYIDACNLRCPQPILRAKKALQRLNSGQILHVTASDTGSLHDFSVFSNQSGNALLEQFTDSAGIYHFVLRRR